MSTVTVRELQKNLKRTLLRVERGETLQITRRRRTVARLTPEIAPTTPPSKPEPWPDLAARSLAVTGGKALKGSPASDLVIESRG
jgi:antitoxin (DNA-binding transcriptional repressor) of toxin-antitoxin stability system